MGVSYISELVTAKEMELLGNICVMLTIILLVTMVVSCSGIQTGDEPGATPDPGYGRVRKGCCGICLSACGRHHGDRGTVTVLRAHGKKNPETDEAGTSGGNIPAENRAKGSAGPDQSPFLYNTLDAIGWLCEEERCQDAVEMVNALAKLFRISISKGHELIPIEKEVEHARSYLKIQNFRYKNQFSYEFQVEEDCLQYYCNKITLQPIIENAIYHGLDRMVDEGQILIRIYSEGEDVVFRVEDNGVGMSEEQCRSILHKEPGIILASASRTSTTGLRFISEKSTVFP